MNKNTIIKIGLIVVVTILLFIWGVSFLKGKRLFNKDKVFYARYEKIEGLLNSDPVLINGFKVGQVQNIYFAPDKTGDLIVEIIIQNDIEIPKNSIAKIYSLDLLGTKGIQLILNTENSSNYQSGDTIISAIESGLKDEISKQILPLKNKTEELISSFDSILLIVQTIFDENTTQDIRHSFESIRTTIYNLQHTTYTFDTLISGKQQELDKIFDNIESITTNFEANNELLSNVIQNFSDISDSLSKANVAETIKQTNKVLSEVNDIVYKINNGEGSLGMLLNNDTLYYNIENATYNLNELIIDINNDPKKYLHFSIIDLGNRKKKKKVNEE